MKKKPAIEEEWIEVGTFVEREGEVILDKAWDFKLC